MAFFSNRTVNLLNAHYTIVAIANGGGGAFFMVYLLKAGISVPTTLLALAALFASRLAIRTFLLPLAIRIGLRRTVLVGAVAMGFTFVALAEVTGVNWSLFWLVIVSATADCIYWPSYHAYFAALGDEEHRGSQLGLREAVAAAVGIVSPLVAGWLLVTFGPRAAFYTTGVIQALSAIPILWTPDVPVAKEAPGAFKAALSGAALFVGDGLAAAAYFLAWQLALFVSLDSNIMAFGGAVAAAALVGAVSGLFVGRLIDAGKGARAVWIAIVPVVVVTVLRIVSAHHPVLAVIANALGAFGGCLYIPTMMTAVYNQAKRSPCVTRFHIAAEGGWDVGISAGLLAAAGLIWLGVPINWTISIALIGLAMVFILLRRYYATHQSELIDASAQPEEAVRI